MIDFILLNKYFFIFILLMGIFLFLKRDKVEVQGYFPFSYMILFKTKYGLSRMSIWPKKKPRLFLYLSYFSIFIGIIGIIVSIGLMIWSFQFMYEHNITSGGGLVLPLKTENGMNSTIPIFYVPFFYWIFALFILAFVHEFAHGVIAERLDIKIKSSGFAFGSLLLPILPAAFVEPDEKDLEKSVWWKQIAIFGAGPTSNFIFGFLFLLCWIFVAGPFIDNTMQIGTLEFSSVMNESDLANYNVTSGSLVAFNGNINKTFILDGLSNLTINQSLNLTINSSGVLRSYNIKTFKNPDFESKGMIGISGLNFNLENKEEYLYLGQTPIYFERSLYYFWLLNLGIGMMNLLPLWITDGGQILRVLLNKFVNKKTALFLFNILCFISFFMIIFTLKPNLLFDLFLLF